MRILEKSCGEFVKTRNALDRMLRVLRESGVGAERKRSDIFTPELENRLWSTQVLGMHSSESLLNAVFYLNGKGLCLRCVQEHHNLRFSQFVREENPPRFIYVECGSKNHSGGSSNVGENKMVPIYSIHEAGERDHFFC